MVVDSPSLEFLESLTRDTVEASRVRPNQRVDNSPANSLGITLIRPGGRSCYPAMWVRDFSMALEAGFITPEEISNHLRLIAQHQMGDADRHLKTGAVIPAFSIPDHINFDGGAVFFPGTMSPGDDQGGEPFGIRPPICDHYEFIHIAYRLYKDTKSKSFLVERIGEMTMLDHLLKAFAVPEIDESKGGLVSTTPATRAVGFGFYDALYLTGAMLFPTVLRYRAAKELAELLDDPQANLYRKVADSIAAHVPTVFRIETTGWLRAATEIGSQPDVWGTLFALHLNLLTGETKLRALATIAQAVHENRIEYQGAVRHLPVGMYWPQTANIANNVYQNGAYWHTPSGWLIKALAQVDEPLARAVFNRYVTHMKQNDFRKGASFNAPWECFGRDGHAAQNAVYLASVAVPLVCFRELT